MDVEIVLPKRKEPWKVWVWGDAHIGADSHDHHKWMQHLTRAQEEGWRSICVGDAVEMVGTDFRAAAEAVWQQAKTPSVQIQELEAACKGLLFDAALTGNHDLRLGRPHGVDLWDDIVLPRVRAKKRPSKWMGFGGVLTYRQGGAETHLALSHGQGAAVNAATQLKAMMVHYPGVHAYLSGHTHRLLVEWWRPQGPHAGPVLWGKTGSYMQFARYQQSRLWTAGPPPLTGSVLLTLDPKGGIAEASLLT